MSSSDVLCLITLHRGVLFCYVSSTLQVFVYIRWLSGVGFGGIPVWVTLCVSALLGIFFFFLSFSFGCFSCLVVLFYSDLFVLDFSYLYVLLFLRRHRQGVGLERREGGGGTGRSRGGETRIRTCCVKKKIQFSIKENVFLCD